MPVQPGVPVGKAGRFNREVPVPETAPATNETAKVMEELAAFEAARAPKPPPAKPGDKGAKTEAVADKAETAVEGGGASVSTDAPPEDGKGVQPPSPEDAVDLSGLPEDVRKEIEEKQLSAAARKKLREGFLRQKDYTQKTQAVAADRDAAEKYKFLVSDPERAKRVAKILMGEEDPAPKAAPESKPEAPIDPIVDPEGFVKAVEERAKRKAEEAVNALWRERVEVPMENRAALNAAFQQYADQNEVPKDVMLAAVKSVLADANETGAPLSPAMIPVLVRPHVELARLKAAAPASGAEKNGKGGAGRPGGLAEVASPNGRIGSSGGTTIPVPKHIREGRLARTADELTEEVDYAIARRVSGS